MAAVTSQWIKTAAAPELFYEVNEDNLRLLLAVPLLWRAYIPNVFAWNGHIASIFGYVKLPSWSHRRVDIEVITLPDGGTVSIEWGAKPQDHMPIILMLPGINNDASMPYIQHLMTLVLNERLGIPAAVNWRGLGGLKLTAAPGTGTPKPYCGICSDDVQQIISHLRRKYPSFPVYAIGWSMGGCMLVRHMADSGDECQLAAAMAVSPALDIGAIYEHFSGSKRSLGSWYGLVIGFKLWLYFIKHRHELAGGPVSIWDAFCGMFKGYEQAVFVPLWGLRDVNEYHERASVHTSVANITRPLLVVHARDDPVVPVASLPLKELAANPNIITAITRHGGHMGYTSGRTPFLGAWTDRVLLHYLRHIMERKRSDGHGAPQSKTISNILREHSKL